MRVLMMMMAQLYRFSLWAASYLCGEFADLVFVSFMLSLPTRLSIQLYSASYCVEATCFDKSIALQIYYLSRPSTATYDQLPKGFAGNAS